MKKFQIVLVSSLLFLFTNTGVFASIVSLPEITNINPGIKNFSEPFVSGFTEKDSSVLVYIDGKYINDAEIVLAKDKNLFYYFFRELPSSGIHSLKLIARNSSGVLSPPTKDFDFFIIKKLDKPIIIKTNFNDSAYFYGESLNENFIDLYIDNKLYSTKFIKKNTKNTFEFNEKKIKNGNHTAYFVARDAVGRKSIASDIVNFRITKHTQKQEAKTPVSERLNLDLQSENNKSKPSILPDGIIEEFVEEVVVEGVDNINILDEEKNGEGDEKINQILKEINSQNPEEIGALTENGQRQSDLKWNLIIFLAFLVAVILWIIWVNKEMQEEESVENSDEEVQEKVKE